MRYLVAALFFLLASTMLKAEDLPAYIIKSNGDTVKGTVDAPVHKKGLLNGKKEIDFKLMASGIKFGEGNGKQKKVEPGDLKGLGIQFENQWYHFEVFDAMYGQKVSKLMEKMAGGFKFFILRVDDGPLPVYKLYLDTGNPAAKNPGPGISATVKIDGGTVELYVKNAEYGFVEVSPVKLVGGKKELKEFLRKYLKLEEEFLSTIDDKAKFTEAEEILKRYNTWKKAKG